MYNRILPLLSSPKQKLGVSRATYSSQTRENVTDSESSWNQARYSNLQFQLSVIAATCSE